MKKTLTDAKATAFKITKAFEGTGYTGLAGNFDKQGFTFGVLGWCLGQGTLQGLISEMYKSDPELFRKCATVYVKDLNRVTDLTDVLLKVSKMSAKDAVQWSLARQINNKPLEHWKDVFFKLGTEIKFQAVQRQLAEFRFVRAFDYCKSYNLLTERAFCFFFDCVVQQGSLKSKTKLRIETRGYNKLKDDASRFKLLAQAMADQANPRWANDVYSRRIAIANGIGFVHGKKFNFKEEFDLTDDIITSLPKTLVKDSLLGRIKRFYSRMTV